MLQLLKYCMFLESRLTKPGNIFPIFNCPVFVSVGRLLPHFPVLSWQGCHPVQYSAAVAHFAQDSRFSVHSEIFFLLTWFWQVVVWVLLLSYQVETVWHSPLTSDISTASHWLFFSFSKGWKPLRKSQHINSFWNTLTSLAATTMAKNDFSSPFRSSVLTSAGCLNAVNRWRQIRYLVNEQNKRCRS